MIRGRPEAASLLTESKSGQMIRAMQNVFILTALVASLSLAWAMPGGWR